MTFFKLAVRRYFITLCTS